MAIHQAQSVGIAAIALKSEGTKPLIKMANELLDRYAATPGATALQSTAAKSVDLSVQYTEFAAYGGDTLMWLAQVTKPASNFSSIVNSRMCSFGRRVIFGTRLMTFHS
jgi:hypothetical protein